jgi:hypothetical protein
LVADLMNRLRKVSGPSLSGLNGETDGAVGSGIAASSVRQAA